MAHERSIDDLLANGSDEEKLMRLKTLADSDAPATINHALTTQDSKLAWQGLAKWIDVCMLAESLSDKTLRRQYNAVAYAYQTLNIFHSMLKMNPEIVQQHQETAYPLVLAMGMLLPEAFGYEAAWHVMSGQDLIRDPHEKAATGLRHVEFYANALEPFLFKEIFDARDRGDKTAQQNLTILWQANLQFIYSVFYSKATQIVRDRLHGEEQRKVPDLDRQGLVKNMRAMFNTIDRVERERRLRIAQQQGDAISTKTVFGPAATEIGAVKRPDTGAQFIAGTPESDRLKRPDRAQKMLAKFKPPEGSKPN